MLSLLFSVHWQLVGEWKKYCIIWGRVGLHQFAQSNFALMHAGYCLTIGPAQLFKPSALFAVRSNMFVSLISQFKNQ